MSTAFEKDKESKRQAIQETQQKLQLFHAQWELESDLIRCKDCGRGIHWTNMLIPMNHSADCKNPQGKFPWVELKQNLTLIYTRLGIDDKTEKLKN